MGPLRLNGAPRCPALYEHPPGALPTGLMACAAQPEQHERGTSAPASSDSVHLPELRTCGDCRLSVERIATIGTDSLAGYLTNYPV